MESEKRLIDANKLIVDLKTFKGLGAIIAETLVRFVKKQPAVDAVEVVRCKDCKYWFAEEPERCKMFGDSLYGWCHRQRNIYEADYKDIRQDNDFCSDGERSNENGQRTDL